MYIRKPFEGDRANALSLIQNHPFATLIGIDYGKPTVTHLPILIESTEPLRLVGHMSRANPQWQGFSRNSEATLIFNGPHSYITPRWYVSGRDVPTWNYAVAHAHGKLRLFSDYNELVSTLTKLSAHFESGAAQPWEFYLPDDLKGQDILPRMIIGFDMTVERLEVSLKLNQNRPLEDRLSVIEALSSQQDDDSRAIAEMMRLTLPTSSDK